MPKTNKKDRRFYVILEEAEWIGEMMGEVEDSKEIEDGYDPMLEEDGVTTYKIIKTEWGQIAVPQRLIEICKNYEEKKSSPKSNKSVKQK